jgi:hypothetical protein
MLAVQPELTVAGSSSMLEQWCLQSRSGMAYSQDQWCWWHYHACGGAHVGGHGHGHGQTRSQRAPRPRQKRWQVSFFRISPPFQSLSIKNMYGVCSNSREIYVLLTSAREKSGAVVGKNEGQGAKLEGFS